MDVWLYKKIKWILRIIYLFRYKNLGHLSKRKNSYNRYKIHIFKIYQYTIKISLHDVAEKYLLRYDTLLIMIIQWQLESYKDMIYNGNLTEWSAILFYGVWFNINWSKCGTFKIYIFRILLTAYFN